MSTPTPERRVTIRRAADRGPDPVSDLARATADAIVPPPRRPPAPRSMTWSNTISGETPIAAETKPGAVSGPALWVPCTRCGVTLVPHDLDPLKCRACRAVPPPPPPDPRLPWWAYWTYTLGGPWTCPRCQHTYRDEGERLWHLCCMEAWGTVRRSVWGT